MTLNVYLLVRAAFHPHQWFMNRRGSGGSSKRPVEHWNEPEPGVYVHEAGKGWSLWARDADHGRLLASPKPVVFSVILCRYLFQEEYEDRKREGVIHEDDIPVMKRLNSTATMSSASSLFKRKNSDTDNPTVETKKYDRATFFRLDDGKTWVRAWDAAGVALPGPYDPWLFDLRCAKFRRMDSASNPSGRLESKSNVVDANGVEFRDSEQTALAERSAPDNHRTSTTNATAQANSLPPAENSAVFCTPRPDG